MKRATINRVYIPEFNGNRDLNENDQVFVEMDLATIKEKEEFAAMKYLKGGKMEYVKKEYTALKKKVTKIGNYFDDNEQPIDTAKKLIEDSNAGSAESIELVEELWNRLMGYAKKLNELGEDLPDDSGEALTEGES